MFRSEIILWAHEFRNGATASVVRRSPTTASFGLFDKRGVMVAGHDLNDVRVVTPELIAEWEQLAASMHERARQPHMGER